MVYFIRIVTRTRSETGKSRSVSGRLSGLARLIDISATDRVKFIQWNVNYKKIKMYKYRNCEVGDRDKGIKMDEAAMCVTGSQAQGLAGLTALDLVT